MPQTVVRWPCRRNSEWESAAPKVEVASVGALGTDGRDYGVVSLNNWRIGDLARAAARRAGMGGMPEPALRADLKAGRLVKLNVRNWRGGEYDLQAVHKVDTPPGPARRWLIERLSTLTDPPPG